MPAAEDSTNEAPVSIDPAWWEAIEFDSDGTERDWPWGSPHNLGPKFDRAALKAREASDATPSDPVANRKASVLTVLAKLASPMLVASDWQNPYKPFIQFGDGRSAIPDDLTKDELDIVHQVSTVASPSSLRARAADVAWWYRDRRDTESLQNAVDTYLGTPLTPDTWHVGGGDNWRRALEIVKRQGRSGHEALDRIVAAASSRLLSGDAEDRWFLRDLSEFLLAARRIDRETIDALAQRLEASAEEAFQSDFRLARSLQRHANSWRQALGDREASLDGQVRVADLYEAEADDRLSGGSGGALAADRFLEQAITTLRDLPGPYKVKRGLDARIVELNAKLDFARQSALDHMSPIELDPIDITEYVAGARRAVTGLGPMESLLALAHIIHFQDAAQLLDEERGRFTGSLRSLFGSATYSQDGRKVATSDTDKSEDGVSDNRIFAEAVRSFSITVGLTVQGRIEPALEAFSLEHRLTISDLYNLCTGSPVVPPRHARLWAVGLAHGFNGDFVSAVAMLVPQLEQAIRFHLKARGVYTLHAGEGFVEMEKGINSLLELEEATEIFGPDLVFTFRALLCEQTGPNLRNDLAHGLLDDATFWAAAPTYTWWLCLRLVVVAFANEHPQPRAGADEVAVGED